MPKLNPFSSKKKSSTSSKDHLSSLGLDPSLFEDPEFSDDDENDEELLKEFSKSSSQPSKVQNIDVKSLLKDNDNDDIEVELNDEDLDENSNLNKELSDLALIDENGNKEETIEQKIQRLEEELIDTKRTAIFFKQQNHLNEAKEQLLEIKRIQGEIKELKESLIPQSDNNTITVPNISYNLPKTNAITIPNEINNNESSIPGIGLSPLNPVSIQDQNISKSPILINLNELPNINNQEELKEDTEINSSIISPETNIPIISNNVDSSEDNKDHSKNDNNKNIEIQKQSQNKESSSIISNINISDVDLEAEFMNLGNDNKDNIFEQKIIQCEEQQKECMNIASQYKINNNKQEAIKWLKIAILFKKAIEHLKEKQDIDIDEIIAQKPSKSQINKNDNTNIKQKEQKSQKHIQSTPIIRTTNEPSPAEKKRILMFVALETKLKAQAERWKERGLKCKAAGEIPLAVKYLNERKLMVEDIDKIIAGKQCKGMPLPEYTKEQYTHLQEIHFRNRLQPDELEIAIIKATNIKPPSGSIVVDSFVSVTCPFAVDTQTWKSHKVANSNSPTFKEVHKFKIERGKRSFAKAIERKKISFELFHSRWLRGDLSLGKCDLNINDIKSKSEILVDLPILTNGKRDTGGKLSVRIRICYPLLKKHILEETEDIIVIQKHFPIQDYTTNEIQNEIHNQNIPTQQTITTNSPTTVKQTNITPKSNSTPKQSPKSNTKINEEKKSDDKSISQLNKLIDKDEEEPDYNPIESMVSNDVLEWALEETKKQILYYKQQRKPVPEDLITREQQIELKLQLLIIQIQTGKVTEEQYIQNINDKIKQEKDLARKYIQEKNQKGAKLALYRAKIMTTELEGE